jgi:hypothetical protein
MTLFNKITDRQHTQLAYRVKYWPFNKLSEAAKELISWKSHKLIKKIDIELHCSETKEALYYRGRLYKILWAYNNVPTENEWNRHEDQELIYCEFRTSPAIPELAVVVLSFQSYVTAEGNNHVCAL